MAAYENYIKRDTAGGASLIGFPGDHLEIDEPTVFALDILDAPNLKTIVFKRLKGLKRPHLVLGNLPKLETLTLPSGHPGAIIHCYGTERPQPFVLSGAISELDAHWADIRIQTESLPERMLWSRVVFDHATTNFKEPCGHGLLVLMGSLERPHTALTLGMDNDYLLVKVDGLKSLIIDTLGRVHLQELPDLETVEGRCPGTTLTMDHIPALTTITGKGADITLLQRTAGAPSLAIRDEWSNAQLHCPYLEQLDFLHGNSLNLFNCRSLTRIGVPLDVDLECFDVLPEPVANIARFDFHEGILGPLLEQAKAGDRACVPTILTVLQAACEPNKVAVALQQLRSLCDMGIDPEDIWHTRMVLSARNYRHRTHGRKRNNLTDDKHLEAMKEIFKWRCQEDLEPQAWEADLDIWAYCQQQVHEAAAYTETIAYSVRMDTPPCHVMDTLLRKSGSARTAAQFYPLTLSMMSHSNASLEPNLLYAYGNHKQYPTQRVFTLLQSPLATAADKHTVAAFICENLPLEAFAHTLPPLIKKAPEVFRSCLLSLSRAHTDWFYQRMRDVSRMAYDQLEAQYRQQLLSLALAPTGAANPHL